MLTYKKVCPSKDILIEPQLGNIGFMNFDRSKEATAIGEKATQNIAIKLAALQLPDHLHTATQQLRLNPQLPRYA
jgi:hypothetical protein